MNAGTKQIAAIVVVSVLLVSGLSDSGAALSRSDHADGVEPLEPSQLTDATRANTLAVGTNAAVGLTLRADALDDRIATLAYRERLAATTPANQTAVLAAELRLLRRETNRLIDRQAETLEQHALRNVTTEEFLFELARIDASAQSLDARRNAVVTRLDDLSAVGVDTRALRADLMTLRGPVREEVAAMAVGAVDESSVSVETSRNSVALSVSVRNRAIVERYRADYLDAPTDQPATIEGVTELVAAMYPVEWENRTGYTIRRIDADLLYVEVEYTDGVVVAYVDRPTARVFKEFHYGPRSVESAWFGRFSPEG